ncbi:hypothetical protein GOP47_0027227, partial [Adiantum capillus-veneris]
QLADQGFVTPFMTKEGSSEYHYPPVDEESAPLKQPPEQSGSHYYGTFQGNPSYPQPSPPGFPHPTQPEQHFRGATVPGYPVLERTPEQYEGRLPCCGIGLGWFLFIIGWFLASVPWHGKEIDIAISSFK